MISLVAFLGNYGSEYAQTRHNVAWLFEESLYFSHKLSWQNKFKGKYACVDGLAFAEWVRENLPEGEREKNIKLAEKIYFLKPETYMNASGESIGTLAQFFKIQPAEILVVHDELELPQGAYSLKWSGGLGGHNGLRSTKATLGTQDFWRLRLGIGRPSHPDVAGYVLSRFSEDERITLSLVFEKASELLTRALTTAKPEKLVGKFTIGN